MALKAAGSSPVTHPRTKGVWGKNARKGFPPAHIKYYSQVNMGDEIRTNSRDKAADDRTKDARQDW